MIPHYGISYCGVIMKFLYSTNTNECEQDIIRSLIMSWCGVYNIPETLQTITTFFTYYGTDLVFHWRGR